MSLPVAFVPTAASRTPHSRRQGREVSVSGLAVRVVTTPCPSLRCTSAYEVDHRCTHRCRRSALSAPPEDSFLRPQIGRKSPRVPPNNALLCLGGSQPRCLVEKRTSARNLNNDDHRNHRRPGDRPYSLPRRRDFRRVGRQALWALQLYAGGSPVFLFCRLATAQHEDSSTARTHSSLSSVPAVLVKFAAMRQRIAAGLPARFSQHSRSAAFQQRHHHEDFR
jgi:hypothetical protein